MLSRLFSSPWLLDSSLKTYADIIKPDMVLLVYVSNDITLNEPPFDPWSKISLKGKSPSKALEILLWKSRLYRLGCFISRYTLSSRQTTFDKKSRGFTESIDALSAIATFCEKRNIRFVTFFYQSKLEAEEKLLSPLFSEIRAIGEKLSFPVVDIGAWWAEVDARSVTNSIVDAHPNERGHEIIAAGMVDFLIKNGQIQKQTKAN